MVNCTQNNIISSVLLANKQSRDKILPILNKIRDLSPIEKLDPSISSALSLQKDLLNYNVHANLMFGEFAAIYRPVLANKFKRAFSSMEDL